MFATDVADRFAVGGLRRWSVSWLHQEANEWFFGTRDIWGGLRADLEPTRPAVDRERTPKGGELAYAIACELRSRVATQILRLRAGDNATALESIHSLFPFIRGQAEQRGIDAAESADIAFWMLNRDVRPFTSKWHRVHTKGLLKWEDTSRRFRRELETLRAALVAWSALFRRIALGSKELLPTLPAHPSQEACREFLDPARWTIQPCSVDGLPAPALFAKAYAVVVEREWAAIQAWRRACTRSSTAPLSGIAMSGGGIRSATFALGVLRAVAQRVRVFDVDYISTVSGGGYLGTMVATAFEHGVLDPADVARGPLSGELGSAVVAWLRSRSETMSYGRVLAGTLTGQILGTQHGVADEYQRRLRETWMIARTRVDDFGDVVTGVLDLKGQRLADFKQPAPIQLWNMAINATSPPAKVRMALRGRDADLYTLSRVGAECRMLGFAPPGEWCAEAAMALSGAAVAPTTSEDIRAHSRWIARVAAALGGNLGRWVDHGTGDVQHAPPWWDHVKLLFGKIDSSSGAAFLSDGGHVENTGLYPLLRRRCALILAIDGEEDPGMTFQGLMRLQHLARVEQGIVLEIDLADFVSNDQGLTDSHFSVITVRYPALIRTGSQPIPEQLGIIVYVKLSMTGDEPAYLADFQRLEPSFPHHSTVASQAYDDRTFEAYLALGEHVGGGLVDSKSVNWSLAELVASMGESWLGS